ncbi:unnamed protein product [Amaranthus hypochondriacus]
MKAAPKLILLFKDQECFSDAIFDALQPTSDSHLHRSDEDFQLSLEDYGITEQKACGKIAYFSDENGVLQISLLLVNCYEPPLLSCVVNEILRTIRAGSSSSTVCLTVPCILPAAKLIKGKRSSVYGIHIGPTTKFTEDITKAVEKPPLSLQINYEPLACLVQFVNCLKFPTAVLIGERGTKGEHEVLHEIGEILARAFSLSFMKNKIKLNLREIAKPQEPWRALYG